MSTEGNHGRETIQISLGSTANAVTAHLLNLQGLAAATSAASYSDQETSSTNTTNNAPAKALVDPYVTHTVYKETFVPRVFMVDQRNQFQRSHPTSINIHSAPTWSGPIETHPLQSSHQLQPSLPLPYDTAHTLSQQLVSSSYSNYHVAARKPTTHSFSTSQTARHVNWDLEEEEEEEQDEEEEEDPYERERRLHFERSRWTNNTKPSIQHHLTNFWTAVKEHHQSLLEQDKENPSFSTTTTDGPTLAKDDYSPRWIDYCMPPYPPPKSNVPLPFASNNNNNVVETWDSYVMGSSSYGIGTLQSWKEDALIESLRHQLEDCDSLQGVTILTEGHGIFAGLASTLLLELQDECPSAGRLVYHVVDPSFSHQSSSPTSTNDGWQPNHVKLVRTFIETGLTLHQHTNHAHAVLPLSIQQLMQHQNNHHHHHQSSSTTTSTPQPSPATQTRLPLGTFQATATLAMALETATLAYRINSTNSKQQQHNIGLAGGPYGGAGIAAGGYGTAPNLSFGEFLATLQPQSRYSMLELDVLLGSGGRGRGRGRHPPPDASALATAFVQGTSLERDHRIKSNRMTNRPRDVMPGAWLGRRRNDDSGGLLEAASPSSSSSSSSYRRTNPEQQQQQQQHYNFALTTSLRPSMNWESFLPCAMEGMWRRYRPQVAMGVVVQQSLKDLTTSQGYGAGSYWKPLVFGNNSDNPSSLAVLRNSTQSYEYLHSIAFNMKRVLQQQSLKFRGYHNRDVVNNVLPDADDCMEAMDTCWNVRDVYEPPDRHDEEEGTYFANDGV